MTYTIGDTKMRHTDKVPAVRPVNLKNPMTPLLLWSEDGIFELYTHRKISFKGEAFIKSRPEEVECKLILEMKDRSSTQIFKSSELPIVIPKQSIDGATHVVIEFVGVTGVGLSLEVAYE